MRELWAFSDKTYPPGPVGRPIIGSLLELLRHPIDFMMELGRYGDLAHFTLGPHHAYLVKSPEYLYEIFVKQAHRVRRSFLAIRGAKKFVGQALALLDGEHHRRDRKLMTPAFHQVRLEGYAQVMREETERMLARWHAGDQLEIDKEMQTCSLNIAARSLFGSDVQRSMADIATAMEDFARVLAFETRSVITLPDWLPIEHKRRMKRAIAVLNRLTREIIRERRNAPPSSNELLSMLMAAVDEETGRGMTPQQLHDETIFLFVAAHETTASMMAWTLYLLDRHPEVYEKLMAEIDGVLGSGPPEWSLLPRLEYLDQVIKETLRLYPSAWLFARTAATDFTLGEFTIYEGSSLFISPLVTQLDARYFPEPMRFRPERFAAREDKRAPRLSFLAFGAGATACLGQQFAITEAKIVLSMILQRYRLGLSVPGEIKPIGLALLRPEKEMRMSLRQRRP